MLGLASYLPTAHRERMIVAVIAAIVGMAALLTPSAAHAGGCTDSWTNTAGGSWFTPGNWSKEAPPAPKTKRASRPKAPTPSK